MDAVVLDWTISLADKDRMKTCVVSYLAQEAKESTTIDPFMPKTRTFLLENLRPNHVSSKLFCLFSFGLPTDYGHMKIKSTWGGYNYFFLLLGKSLICFFQKYHIFFITLKCVTKYIHMLFFLI